MSINIIVITYFDISNTELNIKKNDILYKIGIKKSSIKSRISLTLLNHPDGKLSKYKIAQLSNTKYPVTHKFLNDLEDAKITKDTRVLDYEKLFYLLLQWRKKPKYREYMLKDPLTLLRNTNLDYVVTTYQAENKTQNYLFPMRTDFYIHEDDLFDWHDLLSENGLVGKGNTRILYDDEHAFYNSKYYDELKIVSPVQLIIDLYSEGSVCIEAADMLLKKVIRNAV